MKFDAQNIKYKLRTLSSFRMNFLIVLIVLLTYNYCFLKHVIFLSVVLATSNGNPDVQIVTQMKLWKIPKEICAPSAAL